MEVFWLQRAIKELRAERAYIAQHNPIAAREVADYIYQASLHIAAIPLGAPEAADRTYREVILTRYRYSYIIRYRIKDDRIEILRMIHGRRKRRPRY